MPVSKRRLILQVECLEDRLVPTDFVWIGGKNVDWENPANWQGSDNVHTFPHNTANVTDTVTLNDKAKTSLPLTKQDITIDQLTVTSGFTKTLSLAKNLTVAKTFSQQGGTVTGQGKLVIAGEGEILVAVVGGNATRISYEQAKLSVVGTLSIASTTDIKNTQFVLFKDSTVTVEK